MSLLNAIKQTRAMNIAVLDVPYLSDFSRANLQKGFSPAKASLAMHHDLVYEHLYTKRFKNAVKCRFNFMLGDACTVPKTAAFEKGFRGNWGPEVPY